MGSLANFFVLAYSGHIFADEVRPAYLEISEKGTRMPLMPKYSGNSQLFRIEAPDRSGFR